MNREFLVQSLHIFQVITRFSNKIFDHKCQNISQEAFTRAFIQHYSRISRVLVRALDRPTVANRVVHISVQLFSNEQLACQMVKEYNLLYILIVSLNNMIEGILTESTLQGRLPYMSHVARKPVFRVSDQVRHKSTYTVTEA